MKKSLIALLLALLLLWLLRMHDFLVPQLWLFGLLAFLCELLLVFLLRLVTFLRQLLLLELVLLLRLVGRLNRGVFFARSCRILATCRRKAGTKSTQIR